MAKSFKKKITAYLLYIAQKKEVGFFSGIVILFLEFLSFLYGLILYLRFVLYQWGILKAVSGGVKVVSVGNITVGGTGKTPLVEVIVRYLISQQKRVAIISRGYLGTKTNNGIVADEPQMFKTNFPDLPVIIDKNRQRAISRAKTDYNCDCVVLDDAFQNLRVRKNINLVCINCIDPFSNKHLLPRGLMRLPFCYLETADVIVLTHAHIGQKNISNIISQVNKYNSKALICKSEHVPELLYDIKTKKEKSLEYVNGKKVAILCGIASPDSLENSVLDLNAKVSLKFCFDDHHKYSREEISEVLDACAKNDISTIITTAKDQPRIINAGNVSFSNFEILVLKIKLEIENNGAELFKRISDIFAA